MTGLNGELKRSGRSSLDFSPTCLPFPVTKAGCPIQARFWLEGGSTALDQQLLYCKRSPRPRSSTPCAAGDRGPPSPTQAKTGLEWGTQPSLPVERGGNLQVVWLEKE